MGAPVVVAAGEAVGALDGLERGEHTQGGAGRPALQAERALDRDDQLEVQRVAGVAGDDVAEQRPSEQGQVADQVEDLVAHELVAKRRVVQHAALADHDRVVERAARAPGRSCAWQPTSLRKP